MQETQEKIKCPNCKSLFDEQPVECFECGYPFSGSEKQKSIFIGQQIMKESEIEKTKKTIRKSQNILYFIGAFSVIVSLFKTITESYSALAFAVDAFLGMAFILLGLLAKKQPFIFILTALALLLLVYTLQAINNPHTLYQGVLLKLFFIGSLIFSLTSIKKATQIQKESIYLSKNSYK